MKSPLSVGIAGYGVVGKRRRLFIDQNPHFKTVAVSDVSFGCDGVSGDGVSFFSDYKRLLKTEIDVVFVSLPNYLAAEATIMALKRGIHVFCEKPPGRTVRDIQRVIDVERRFRKLRLKYGFNHRYHQSVVEAKRIIQDGEYGKVVNIKGIYGKSNIIPFASGWRSERRFAGGGILLDQGIHMLDMVSWFAGDFEEVKSFVSNDYWHHDVEDNAYAIMRNRAGCVAMIHSTATQWQHRFRLEITLEQGLIELTGILSGSKSYGEEKLRFVPRKDGSSVGSFLETRTSYHEDNSWKEEVDEFAEAVVKGKRITNGSSAEALKVMELVYRVYHADERWRKQFRIPGVAPQSSRKR